MSKYHTQALTNVDIFTVMGSIYAEVARYDSAISSNQSEQASQAVTRAKEIIEFVSTLQQINEAQKQEIKKFSVLFYNRAKKSEKSGLDDYLLPFAIAARRRQLS